MEYRSGLYLLLIICILMGCVPSGSSDGVHIATNTDFGQWVRQSGYVVSSDTVGWVGVYDAGGWRRSIRSGWNKGPGDHAPDQPVRLISYYDAQQYCRMRGQCIPSLDQLRSVYDTLPLPHLRYWSSTFYPGGGEGAHYESGLLVYGILPDGYYVYGYSDLPGLQEPEQRVAEPRYGVYDVGCVCVTCP